MYFYYFLMAVHLKPKFINAAYITIAQILQMIVGVSVTAVGSYLLWFDKEVASLKGTEDACFLKPENVISVLVVYGSYLFLFLQFFVRRYLSNSSKRAAKEVHVNGYQKETIKKIN
jgi:elongation of very long chain fatty acids protein 6